MNVNYTKSIDQTSTNYLGIAKTDEDHYKGKSMVFVVRLAVLKQSTIIGKLAILLENDNFVRKDPLNDLAAPESLYRARLIQDVINIAAFNEGNKSEGLSQVGCTPSSYRTGAHNGMKFLPFVLY
ncbi:hypothetical protein C8J56DRAFT_1032011 [Mycena floridula]|nr:hypothetical protein C8J56DRAFT_1032011 [Mycena floridula]